VYKHDQEKKHPEILYFETLKNIYINTARERFGNVLLSNGND
jgi:hypothetical protein